MEEGRPPAPGGPLAGIVVVDLTRVLAGPFCTLVLADQGARVIKVERPGRGDDARHIGPFRGRASAYFHSLNRGKESIALDLRDPADREIFERLLARADVLVENFRPGVMERLGYAYDELRTRFPKLVYARTSGFGSTGPERSRPAYDIVVQALGGVMSLTGHPGSPPTRVGTSIGDLAAGLFTAAGIASALVQRERTGRGTFVDVAMLDSQVALLENAIARLQITGEVPGPLGSRHPSIAPFQAFATGSTPIVIAAGNDALFTRLAGVLGAPELAEDPRFATNADRCRNVDALEGALEERLAGEDAATWIERLEAAGIPCAPILDVAQVVRHPQVRARNMLVRVHDRELGEIELAGNPIKTAGHPDPETRRPAPELDADRAAILRELGIGPSPARSR